jgi:hypothetical protein
MNKQDAIDVIKQVYSSFKGTIQEHRTVQEAIDKIGTLEEPSVETKEAKTKEAKVKNG